MYVYIKSWLRWLYTLLATMENFFWKLLKLNAAARPIPFLYPYNSIADILLRGKIGFNFLNVDYFREWEFILMLSWNPCNAFMKHGTVSDCGYIIFLMLLGFLMVIKSSFAVTYQPNISGPCFWNSVFAFWSTIRCSSRICLGTLAVQYAY
jgi:hypothetical protein